MLLILHTLLGLISHEYEDTRDKSDSSALALSWLWKFAISAEFMVFVLLVQDYIQHIIKPVHKTCDDITYFTQTTMCPFLLKIALKNIISYLNTGFCVSVQNFL